MAEFKVEKIRLYVNFLDSKLGRGCFMVFISSLILQNDPVEVIVFLITFIIGSLNLLIGCKQGSDAKKEQNKPG